MCTLTIDSFTLDLMTTADTDVLDLTPAVRERLAQAPVTRGLLTLFIPGSTAALTTIEFESGAVADLKAALERLAPSGLTYQHDQRWGDGNGYSHVRAALLKPSLTIPIQDRQPRLGTWQQIVLLDFDNRPRRRQVLGQILGLAEEGH